MKGCILFNMVSYSGATHDATEAAVFRTRREVGKVVMVQKDQLCERGMNVCCVEGSDMTLSLDQSKTALNPHPLTTGHAFTTQLVYSYCALRSVHFFCRFSSTSTNPLNAVAKNTLLRHRPTPEL